MFAPMFEVFLDWLEKVFKHLVMTDLKLKPSKCGFWYNEVKFLGHVVCKDGVVWDAK